MGTGKLRQRALYVSFNKKVVLAPHVFVLATHGVLAVAPLLLGRLPCALLVSGGNQ